MNRVTVAQSAAASHGLRGSNCQRRDRPSLLSITISSMSYRFGRRARSLADRIRSDRSPLRDWSRSAVQTSYLQDQLEQRLPASLASRVRFVRMDQTTAVLAVASPAWATRIRQHRAALRHIVESSLGRPCTDIRLCIIPVQAAIRPSHEPVKTQTRHIDTMRRLSKSTSNAKLAAALRRLVQQLENAD
ncbi:DciA family protein [Abyssibacter profundi]|uniref:DUF721 domain-containing protein n=1 Tax=Abyssibacter profundi TaxID=2182787 RepID=A0A363UMQ9_9GAMM|nr:hypothetical protein [Nevskiales bacterium]PWN56702.1 hypothetical protein DEH80_07000 [Abyssibacter profundi]